MSPTLCDGTLSVFTLWPPSLGPLLTGRVVQQAVHADARVSMYTAPHLSFHTPASASISPLPTQQPANQPVQASCYGNGCLGDNSFVSRTSFPVILLSFSTLTFPRSFLSSQLSDCLSSHICLCLVVFPSFIVFLGLSYSLENWRYGSSKLQVKKKRNTT